MVFEIRNPEAELETYHQQIREILGSSWYNQKFVDFVGVNYGYDEVVRELEPIKAEADTAKREALINDWIKKYLKEYWSQGDVPEDSSEE